MQKIVKLSLRLFDSYPEYFYRGFKLKKYIKRTLKSQVGNIKHFKSTATMPGQNR